MRFFKVTVKFGHVGRNYYYRGNLYITAETKKQAAEIAKNKPRVKHDRKDAILQVEEIDRKTFFVESQKNRAINYFSCYNIQQQRNCFYEIENDVFYEPWIETDSKNYIKKHSLRKKFNDDPDYYFYKNKRNIDCYVA